MTEPVTPRKPRPGFIRSHTGTPSNSPPESATIDTSQQQQQQQPHKSHFDLFHAAHNSNRSSHHPFHHRIRKSYEEPRSSQERPPGNEDKGGSKTNLRQHLQSAYSSRGVAEIQKIVKTPSNLFSEPASVGQSKEGSKDELSNTASRAPLLKRSPPTMDLVRERQYGILKDGELKKSLTTLSEEASSCSRRLDKVYYSILEKVANLHSTIDGLEQLCTASNSLQGTFDSEAKGLESEVQRQVRAYGGFNVQREKIEDLESRVKKEMVRAKGLDDRLEAARARVEQFDAKEREWQARTTKRLTIGWCLAIAIAVLIMIILAVRKLPEITSEEESLLMSGKNNSIPSFVASDLAQIGAKRTSQLSSRTTIVHETLEPDRRLLCFDEL